MAKLKRLLAPKHWKIPKKKFTWVVTPRPGPHGKLECIPLQVIVKNILHLAETSKEAKSIIKKGDILVDGVVRKDHAYPVGLFDVVSIPKINESYRVVPKGYGLDLVKIEGKETNLKICRINKKTILKGGKVQLNLNDGKNLIVSEDKFKTYDSLLIEIPKIKIVEHFPLEKGCLGIVVKGKNAGMLRTVEKVLAGTFRTPTKILCNSGKEQVEILKKYFFVVGKDKALITVS